MTSIVTAAALFTALGQPATFTEDATTVTAKFCVGSDVGTISFDKNDCPTLAQVQLAIALQVDSFDPHNPPVGPIAGPATTPAVEVPAAPVTEPAGPEPAGPEAPAEPATEAK